jgi:hypothetical protein
MIVTAKELRQQVKAAFPSLKAFVCEHVECRDGQYLVPDHDAAVPVMVACWAPLAGIRQTRAVGDCDEFSLIMMANVREVRLRMSADGLIRPEEKAAWAFGDAAGSNPDGRPHAFNIFLTDRGVHVFDRGRVVPPDGYQPLSARF